MNERTSSDSLSGSKAPAADLQTFVSDVEQAPSGVLSRGSFQVKSKLTDDDKNVYARMGLESSHRQRLAIGRGHCLERP